MKMINIVTINQLNFLDDIRNKIIDYVIEDHNKINQEMNKINNSKKYKLNNSLDKKPKRICNKYNS